MSGPFTAKRIECKVIKPRLINKVMCEVASGFINYTESRRNRKAHRPTYIGHCKHAPYRSKIHTYTKTLVTADLVMFAWFWFSRILWGGQIREFKNLTKIVLIIALLKKKEKSQILNFVKTPKNRNSRKLKHAKITRSTVYDNHTRTSIR